MNNNRVNYKPSNCTPCNVPQGNIVKRWETWANTGVGYGVTEHMVTRDGNHIRRTCSPIWCSVTDDSGTRMCPPQWWERITEQGYKS